MSRPTFVACGAGYLGDRPCAGLVASATRAADVVVFEALAEATLGYFALARRSGDGFSRRYFDRMGPAIASLVDQGVEVVTSGGIADPASAADYLDFTLRQYGVHARVAAVLGDELDEPQPSRAPAEGHWLGSFAYLGARDLAAAAEQTDGYDVLVTGRCTDTALYLLPLLQRWPDADLDAMAHWTVAGHLAECAGHVAGGNYSGPGWRNVDWTRMTHAVIEADSRPRVAVRAMPGLDGFVDSGTVAEQLLYETTDPAAFLTPDVTVNYSGVRLREIDRGVEITDVRGAPPPPTRRVLSYYHCGQIVEVEVAYGWPDAVEKARRAVEIVRRRCERLLGDAMPEMSVSIFGVDALFGGPLPGVPGSEVEVKARLAFRAADPDIIATILDEVGSLYDCGPPGACDIAGPTVGNPASARPWIQVVEDFVAAERVVAQAVVAGSARKVA